MFDHAFAGRDECSIPRVFAILGIGNAFVREAFQEKIAAVVFPKALAISLCVRGFTPMTKPARVLRKAMLALRAWDALVQIGRATPHAPTVSWHFSTRGDMLHDSQHSLNDPLRQLGGRRAHMPKDRG